MTLAVSTRQPPWSHWKKPRQPLLRNQEQLQQNGISNMVGRCQMTCPGVQIEVQREGQPIIRSPSATAKPIPEVPPTMTTRLFTNFWLDLVDMTVWIPTEEEDDDLDSTTGHSRVHVDVMSTEAWITTLTRSEGLDFAPGGRILWLLTGLSVRVSHWPSRVHA